MYQPIDILNFYKVVKCQKPVKTLPKNLSEESVESVIDLTNMFNTRWSNIDPSRYLECGLSLWKSFSYNKFLNDKVLKKYIKNDKAIKRDMIDSRDCIIKSFSFIKSSGYKTLKEYGATYTSDGNSICKPVYDYFHNHIDSIVTGYMLFNGIMRPNEVELRYIDSIVSDKRNMKQHIKTYTRLIKKLERELC